MNTKSGGIAAAPSVAVVGAGWAGLSAAVRLRQAGAEVTLYEAGRRAGGRARGVEIANAALDNGQHLLIGAYTQTLDLMRTIGVDPGQHLQRLPLRVLVPGRFDLRLPALPAPFHTAVGLLRAHGAGLAERLSAARAMRGLARSDFRLDADLTVSDWLDRHGQHGSLRRFLWEPLCLAALNTPPAQASMQIYANVLRDSLGGAREMTDLLLPRGTLDDLLPAPAVSWLRRHGATVRMGTRVQRIVPDGRRWGVCESDAETQSFDHVVIAVGPYHVDRLLADLAPAAGEAINPRFSHQPIATVYCRYAAPLSLPHPILLLPGPLGQWVIRRGTADEPWVAHALSAHGAWEDHDDEQLAASLHAELSAAVPGVPQPMASHVLREKRATFSCTPGLARPKATTAHPGIWLAGDYVAGDYPATIEGAVRSGRAASQSVLSAAKAGPRP